MFDKKVRLAVLMGGSSSEREISYRSADNIIKSLNKAKYDVIGCDIPDTEDTSWIGALAMAKPDIVLNALHGGKGEDGSIQGLLECMDIPFVGSGVSASALCMDKTLCKTVMKNAGIPVIDSMCVCRGDDTLAAAESAGRLGYPLIVKPNRGGSSIGISVVENAESLKKAIDGIFAEYDDDAIVEKYINGNEVTCAVVLGENGPEVISLLDINKTRGIFDYKAKYEDKEWSGGISSLPSYMQDMINGIAKKAFVLLGCSGYACVDMIIDEEQIYVIEVNTLPGMTEQSLIPNAVKALGTDMGDFLDRLIGDVL